MIHNHNLHKNEKSQIDGATQKATKAVVSLYIHNEKPLNGNFHSSFTRCIFTFLFQFITENVGFMFSSSSTTL